jgi:DNA-binding CsgD family transcriptional regulator
MISTRELPRSEPDVDCVTLQAYSVDNRSGAQAMTGKTSPPGSPTASLQRALAGLTLRDQKVLVWRFQDECTQTQIADRLGLSQMQVSRILHHIIDNTRRLLNAAPDTSGTLNRRSPRRRPSSLDVSSNLEDSSEPPIHSRNESTATLVFSGQTG